jgi:hypothetical protein
MPLPSADEILQGGCKERVLPIQPWVAAHLSDVWQSIQKNIRESMKMRDKQGHVQTSPKEPASVHNQT